MSRRRHAPPDSSEGGPELLRIVQLGAPVLRARARDLEPAEIGSSEIRRLVSLMRTTMHEAPGVGLAAPQVGLGIRLAVIEDPEEFVRDGDGDSGVLERRPLPLTVMINPGYAAVGDGRREFFEGCLSMEGYRALVVRHHRVRAHWLDESGRAHEREFSGWPARIVQHEIDHLDGTVYVDRMEPRSLVTTDSYAAVWADLPVAEVREALSLPPSTVPADSD